MNILEFLFGFPVSGCNVQQWIPYIMVFNGCMWTFTPYGSVIGWGVDVYDEWTLVQPAVNALNFIGDCLEATRNTVTQQADITLSIDANFDCITGTLYLCGTPIDLSCLVMPACFPVPANFEQSTSILSINYGNDCQVDIDLSSLQSLDQWVFQDEATLITDIPVGQFGWSAYVIDTHTVWYRDTGTNAWVDWGAAVDDDARVSKEVIINVNDPEIFGLQYESFLNANTYIQTQAPASGDRWTIRFTGVITENVVLYEYVAITGDNMSSSVIDGSVSMDANGSYDSNNISNCTVWEIIVTPGDYINIEHVVVLESSGTWTANLRASYSQILWGDWFTQYHSGDFILLSCLVQDIVAAIQLPDSLTAMHSVIYRQGHLTMNGWSVDQSQIIWANTSMFAPGTYDLDDVHLQWAAPYALQTWVIWNLSNSTSKQVMTVDAGATLIISGSVVPDINVIPWGSFQCLGDYYSNRQSGLAATDEKQAIDLIAQLSVVISWAWSPVGVVTPAVIGQRYLDTTGPTFYTAYGVNNTDRI